LLRDYDSEEVAKVLCGLNVPTISLSEPRSLRVQQLSQKCPSQVRPTCFETQMPHCTEHKLQHLANAVIKTRDKIEYLYRTLSSKKSENESSPTFEVRKIHAY